MMRKAMVAAFVAGVACMAQAVTYNWTGTGTHTLGSAVTFSEGKDYTFTLTLTATGDAINSIINSFASGNPTLFTLVGAGGTDVRMDVVRSGAWWTGAGVNDGAWSNFNRFPTGDLTELTFSVKGTATANGTLTDIFMAYEQGVDGAGFYQNAAWQTLEVGAISSVGILADYTGTLGADIGVALSVAEAASVPEPTALALLALGVAGLALRRRAV